MTMQPKMQILQSLAIAAEMTGRTFSDAVLDAIVNHLARHPLGPVLAAIDRCCAELSRPLTLADVVSRIDDGRPSADEAWALALSSTDERETVVWNDEVAAAFAQCRPVLNLGDEVGARMAFRDAYRRIVETNKAAGTAASWYPSLGWDTDLRAAALTRAQSAGLLSAPQVAGLLPPPKEFAPAAGDVDAHAQCEKLRALVLGLPSMDDKIRARQEMARAQDAAAKEHARQLVENFQRDA
jgi:hypothetical protein